MAQERFKILDLPIMAPAKCLLCSVGHGDEDRKFIDVGVDHDWYGVVYFCTTCFREIANQIGYVHESRISEVKENYDLIFAFNQELVEENEHLRTAIANRRPEFLGVAVSSIPDKGGKEIPPAKIVGGGKASPADAKHDASKGSADTGGTKSNSDPLESLRI